MAAPFKYYAFISYSRKDSKAAAWLQRRLEWFRFPVKLVPQDRRPPNARYVRPIYRDKTNLENTDEHYWTNIRRALEESRYLIVLCSPHAAASEPVNLEVAHFLQTHGGDASLVVPIIVSGNVTSAGPDAALCPALLALGDPFISRNLPTMVPDAVTAEQDAWEAGFVSLVSYLLRLERRALGDHIQRETKRQSRVLQRWLVAVGMLTVIAAASAWLALRAKREVEQGKREVEQANVVILDKSRAVEKANVVIVQRNKEVETANQEITNQNQINLKNLHEASMADYAVAMQRLERDGKWHEGVAHLARALKWEPGNALVAARLYSTLSLYAAEKQDWPRLNLRHEGQVRSAQFSPDGTRMVTASYDKTAQVWCGWIGTTAMWCPAICGSPASSMRCNGRISSTNEHPLEPTGWLARRRTRGRFITSRSSRNGGWSWSRRAAQTRAMIGKRVTFPPLSASEPLTLLLMRCLPNARSCDR